jgi:membrane-associated protease RseP (regulator of RpoE activity)
MADFTNPQNPAPAQNNPAPAAPAQTDPGQNFLNSFNAGNVNQPAPNTQTPPPAANQDPNAQQQPNNAQQQTDPNTQPAQAPNAPPPDAAFAQMRIHNSALRQTLQQVAPLLGVDLSKLDPKDPDALQAAVSQAIILQQAKQQTQNMDPAVAQQVYEAKMETMRANAKALQASAQNGFNAVIAKYGLNQQEFNGFIDQLASKGINPYEQDVDLLLAYQSLNMDTIIQKEAEKKMKELQDKANHSTAPNQMNGAPGAAPPPSGTPITTMDGLDSILKGFPMPSK